MSIAPPIAGLVPEIVRDIAPFLALRRDLHAHPELSYREHRTARVVAATLRDLGLPVHEGLAGTGVVACLNGREPGLSIGLRADMDALPVRETNAFAHASRHDGVMHACGHDGHVAMLLAAAAHLARHPPARGRIVFIFQPAEEQGAGGQRMVDEGLFDRFSCDSVYALHNWPGLPEGHFAVRPGAMMAGTAGFEIVVTGRGAHAAMPHLGIDAVMVGCQVANALQLLVSRELDPVDAAVLSITQIHAGETMNAIPASAVLRGTVRAFSDEVFAQIAGGMERIASQVCGAFGARAQVRFQRNYPPLHNDPDCTETARAAMRDTVGTHRVREAVLTMAAEDFSYMLRARPGCYALLGAGDGDHRPPDHGGGPCTLHNGSYDFNDRLLAIGASYWVRLTARVLAA